MERPIPYARHKTRVVNIGTLPMGGDYPISVQSMTNTNTLDTMATVDQIIRMADAGCEYARISTPGIREAENLRNIKKILLTRGYKIPLIADVHFNPKVAEVAASIVEKVRINPGNYTRLASQPDASSDLQDDAFGEMVAGQLKPLIKICRDHGTVLRIGSNHGSLSQRILARYGDTPEGMVESVMEYLRIFESIGFTDLVVALKASNPKVMIRANRMLVKAMERSGMNYPLHLGVTEAGWGESGRIKSAVGIGSLLADGIGDTIRVSLTEDPELEIPVAYDILQAAGARISQTEYISCPSCARTLFNIQETVVKIREQTRHLKGLKIAVMGCIVNGPGEMADADYGYVGAGKGKVILYKKQEAVKKDIDEAIAVEELIRLIREQGDWIDP